MTPSKKTKEEDDQEKTPSWCPRCEALNTRVPTKERIENRNLRMVKNVIYGLEEVVCRSCGLLYVNARAMVANE